MKKILILGAGAWQTPYLKLARKMGMQVFATDWSAEAFGRFEADVFEPIDLQNWDASLAFARKHEVDAVFSSADVGVPAAAYIAFPFEKFTGQRNGRPYAALVNDTVRFPFQFKEDGGF